MIMVTVVQIKKSLHSSLRELWPTAALVASGLLCAVLLVHSDVDVLSMHSGVRGCLLIQKKEEKKY